MMNRVSKNHKQHYTISTMLYNNLPNSLKDDGIGTGINFVFEYTRDTIEHHKNNP